MRNRWNQIRNQVLKAQLVSPEGLISAGRHVEVWTGGEDLLVNTIISIKLQLYLSNCLIYQARSHICLILKVTFSLYQTACLIRSSERSILYSFKLS